jgi:hypothetical protein
MNRKKNMSTLVNIYTEAANGVYDEMGEITLVARSVEELLTLINNDMVDTENNYLVTEAQLKRRGVEAEPFKPDYSSDALRVIGECIMNGKNNLDK